MIKDFRELSVVKDFVHKDKSKILEYIEMMYSQDSKLNKIENLEDRRNEAVKLSGLDPEDSDVYDIVRLKHEAVNELMYHFHARFNSNKCHLLFTYQNLFWAYQKTISKQYQSIDAGNEDASKAIKLCGDLTDECDKLIVKMEKLRKDVFPEELAPVAEVIVKKFVSQESHLKLLRQG